MTLGAAPAALVHIHMIGRIGLRNPVVSTGVVRDWLSDLVSRLDMRVLSGPHVEFCNEPGNVGPSGIVMLSTSHASIHCWDELATWDIYSCREFDPQTVLDSLSLFAPIYTKWQLIDRTPLDVPGKPGPTTATLASLPASRIFVTR